MLLTPFKAFMAFVLYTSIPQHPKLHHRRNFKRELKNSGEGLVVSLVVRWASDPLLSIILLGGSFIGDQGPSLQQSNEQQHSIVEVNVRPS